MEYLRLLTGRGQVTIPAEIRKALGLRPHDRVVFRVEDGKVQMQRAGSVQDSYGVARIKGFKSMKQLRRDTERWVADRALKRAGIRLDGKS